jgi:cellulose synthase operon protein C
MSEDKPLTSSSDGEPSDKGAEGEDVLARAAHEIRASARLQALVPLSLAERERLVDLAIDRAQRAAPAPILRPRFGARQVTFALAGVVALAAAVVLYVRLGRPSVKPLAAYAMVVEGEQAARGASATASTSAPVTLRPETRLVLTLTPSQPERDPLLRLVLVRNGRAALLEPTIANSKAGAIKIEATAAELLGPQGDGQAELVVVLGRQLPGDEQLRALVLGAASRLPSHLQMIRRAIALEGFSHSAVDVLVGGCSAVVAAKGAERPRCELAAGAKLRLWVGAPSLAMISIELDGHELPANGTAHVGGTSFALELPRRSGVLSVRLAGQEIAARDLAPAAIFPRVLAADHARGTREFARAIAELGGIDAAAAPEEQLEAMRQRAKIAADQGDAQTARTLRERAIELALSLGRVSVASDETVAILFGLRANHSIAQAMQLLPSLEVNGSVYAEGAVHRDYIRGLLVAELGDLGGALGAYQRAMTTAERIGDSKNRALILGPRADVLQALGRADETLDAVAAEAQRGERDPEVCARVDGLTNAGWLLRDLDPSRAKAFADLAADLAATGCEALRPISLVNQGWLLATGGHFAEARGVMDRIGKLHRAPDGLVTTWTLRLQGEILLSEDPAKAEQQAERLSARAEELCSTELAYEAHLLRARALVALEHHEPAAAALAEAEHTLALWSRMVPLGEGRTGFFARHDELAFTAIPFLLAQARRGRPGSSLALAATVRRSIARFVSSLAGTGRASMRAQRVGPVGAVADDVTFSQFERTVERWPADLGTAAADVPSGAVVGVCEARDAAARTMNEPTLTEAPAHTALLVHPSPQGWLVLVWRGSSIRFSEIARDPRQSHAELTARIAKTALPLLAGAPRVHLHLHRSLAALPLDRHLAASLGVPIAFAVDAPTVPATRCAGLRRALLVINPQRNLWAASESAAEIQRDLARAGFQVDTLEGAAATREAIEAKLADPCTALFAYDGHGASSADGGAARSGGIARDRSDDALLLADGKVLTAAEVLGLPRVPEWVVLNGCTTAAPEGLGLAQAFLLSGAIQVIASLDEVSASAAAEFTRNLFDHAGTPAESVDLAALFAGAIADADVPALRVFER